jgi:flagellar basal-body rod protein FlgG
LDADGSITATGVEVGLGTRVSSTQTNYGQGAFQTTNNPLDFAIEGNGFFRVTDPAGGVLYTRSGNFNINAAQTGWILDPTITIPIEATNIVVTTDGQVQYSTATDTTLQNAGQIQLSTFVNPDGLLKLGDNLYRQTDASGTPTDGNPGDQGIGMIGMVRQGALEASNVEPVQELIDLITTQRAFELNSQVVQAGDQIMQVAANLRRF